MRVMVMVMVMVMTSVFNAMELSLRHHFFSITDKRVWKVIAEAIEPFKISNENDILIKSIAPYDCTYLLCNVIE